MRSPNVGVYDFSELRVLLESSMRHYIKKKKWHLKISKNKQLNKNINWLEIVL